MCIIRSYNVHDSFQPVATIEPTDSSTIRPLFHTDDVVEETKAIPSSINIFSSKVDDAAVVVTFPGAQAQRTPLSEVLQPQSPAQRTAHAGPPLMIRSCCAVLLARERPQTSPLQTVAALLGLTDIKAAFRVGQQEAPGPGLSDSRSMELYHALPIVDLAAYTGPGDASSRKHVAAQWDAALSDVGFVIITGTGVPKVLLDSCRAQASSSG